jgi:uncharacterized protein
MTSFEPLARTSVVPSMASATPMRWRFLRFTPSTVVRGPPRDRAPEERGNMERIFRAIVVLGAAALTSGAQAETAADALKKPLPPVFDPAAIDQSVEPCVDFYQYACGAWLKATPIPPDQQIWWRVSTGAEVARRLLDSRGLQDVKVEATPGMLSDHYDPRSKILRLSQDVYFTPSVAAAGIAAHEAGHAVQDAEDYLPMEARTYIVPVVQLASRIAPWLFVAGLMLQMQSLTWAGVILFGSSSLFAFLTLPVELNASSRAEQLPVSQGIIRGDEQVAGVQNVLGAAA